MTASIFTRELWDTFKSIGEVVAGVATTFFALYKWARRAIAKAYEKHFRQHFDNADFIVKKWPKAYETQQEFKKDLVDIKHQLYPNNGGSLFDQVVLLKEGQHTIQEAIKVNLKLDITPIAKTDAAGNCTFVNTAWMKLTGFNDPAQAYGFGWARAIYEEDREWLRREWIEAVRTKTTLIASYRMQNVQTGEVTKVELNTSIIRDLSGEIVEYMASINPIKKHDNE